MAQTVKHLPTMRETRVRSPGPIPGAGRSPGEENGNPLQYSCLENSMGGGVWWATVHGEEELNKWKGISCSWIRRVKAIVKLIILPKLIHRHDAIAIKTPNGFFTESDKNGVKK